MADSAAAVNEPFDTDQQQLGKLYAKALLGAAGDQAEAVLAELDSLLDDVLARLPDLRAVLDSPRVSHQEKEEMLNKAFQGKMSDTLLNFLKVCSRRRRLDALEVMRRAGHAQLNEMMGRIEVQVATAAPVEPSRLDSLKQQLSQLLGSDVVLSTEVDPELLGGLVVRVGDTVYDGSVANRLERFRDAALRNTANEVRSAIDRFVSQ